MNGLMWFLYLAGALPAVAGVIAVLSVILGVICLFVWLVWLGLSNERNSHLRPPPKMLLVGVAVCAFLLVLAQLVPSKETIYLMAGAKGAEIAVESEVGQEIIDDIQEVVQYQLEALKGDSKEVTKESDK